MRYITATEANQNMSRVLRDVAAGASYTVTSRGKPVAKIGPVEESGKKKEGMEDLIAFVQSLPIIHTGPWTREELYD
jgi:prevent-host-death family protein